MLRKTREQANGLNEDKNDDGKEKSNKINLIVE